jgi:ADP-ribosylglycohydrolase
MVIELPSDYWERVYAAVLGKVIGVYLGRPFEGWWYKRIQEQLGDVEYYVADRLGVPLIVTDDDITGTFTFIRALADNGNRMDISAREIGESWLNYLIEGRTILWWGGLGLSAEHTAYLRLAAGIEAPRSGSVALNGELIATEIGAQIFIDGWAIVAPGDPALAASLAGRAASVSHDGVALDAARCLAAMEAQAFVESDIGRIIETGRAVVSTGSRIGEVIDQLTELRRTEPNWRAAREWLEREHGYQHFAGNVPVVPNHGVIILSLLYGDGDFDRTMSIVNTCGWDTDCNSGNLGCLMGIRGGLAAFDSPRHDWRGPVADRLFLPTADGGRAITDALTESVHLVNSGRALHGLAQIAPKNGARFHFELPGSVQGFAAGASDGINAAVENVAHHSSLGERCLALTWNTPESAIAGSTVRAGTATFVASDQPTMPTYELLASPTLYPGQHLWARVAIDPQPDGLGPLKARLYVRWFGQDDVLTQTCGPEVALNPAGTDLSWDVPELGGAPIAEVGIEVSVTSPGSGKVYLDALGWTGAPSTVFKRPEYDGSMRPEHDGLMWRRAWVDAVDHWDTRWGPAFRVIQDHGRGIISQGTADWRDYRVSAVLTPQLCEAAGLAARIGGLRRYYALMVERAGNLRLERFEGTQTTLATRTFEWHFGESHEFALELDGSTVRAFVDGRLEFDLDDSDSTLRAGGVGLVVAEGRLDADAISVRPIDRKS